MKEDTLSSSARSPSALIYVPQQSVHWYCFYIHYFISVFRPCMTLRKLECLKSKYQEKWRTQKNKGRWPLSVNPKAIVFLWPESSPWSKTSLSGLVPLIEFENEAFTVHLGRGDSLLDAIYSLWGTCTSYYCLFIFGWCWPLLEHSTQESSDFCLCVNLYEHAHTHIHPFCSCPVTATFLTNHLFK